MSSVTLHGVVSSRRLGTILSHEHATARSMVVGVPLSCYTIAVYVDHIAAVIRNLGEPDFKSEAGPRLGWLRWWKVSLEIGTARQDVFVIRHEYSRAEFIEIALRGPTEWIGADMPVRLVREHSTYVKPTTPTPLTTSLILRADPVVTQPHYALLLGGADCVWDDVNALESMLGSTWPGIVIAVNDIGAMWPRRLDHWCSLHMENMNWEH